MVNLKSAIGTTFLAPIAQILSELPKVHEKTQMKKNKNDTLVNYSKSIIISSNKYIFALQRENCTKRGNQERKIIDKLGSRAY